MSLASFLAFQRTDHRVARRRCRGARHRLAAAGDPDHVLTELPE